MRRVRAQVVLCAFAVLASPVPCVAATSTIALSSGSTPVTWSNVGNIDSFLAPDGGNALVVTGTIKTTLATGSGTITITAPSTIAGTGSNSIATSRIAVTCSGPTISGQTYMASKTALTPGGSITCAKYAAGFNSSSVSVTINFFLNDQNFAADTYTAASTAFAIVATAS